MVEVKPRSDRVAENKGKFLIRAHALFYDVTEASPQNESNARASKAYEEASSRSGGTAPVR